MAGQLGFWSVEERLAEISAQGDPLETLAATVEFEMFRSLPGPWARAALQGRTAGFDPLLKLRMVRA